MFNFNQPSYKSQFYLPDWVEARVAAIQTAGYPKFRTGYWAELKQIHANAVRAGVNKYPSVYLPIMYTEDRNTEDTFDINFSIFIIGISEKKDSSEKRLDDVIKVTLNPIYVNFMEEIKNNEWVFNTDTRYIEHQRANLIFDQSQGEEQNQLGEVVEAIQITFNPLTFINKMNN